jgi:hypothetical protein
MLFVSYGAGHIAMVLPVIRALRERHPHWVFDLLALTTAAEEAKRQGFKSLGYRDFVHWYGLERLHSLAGPLMSSTTHPMVDPLETMAYLGVNLADLEDQVGRAQAQASYARQGRWAFYPIGFFRRLLLEMRPDAVVATNSPRSEQAALDAASALGIPTVCMVDLFSPAGDPFLDRVTYADALTTISELGKANLVAGGVPAPRIHVTGSPAFDSLFEPRHLQDAARDRDALGWRGLKVILWPGHPELMPPGLSQLADPTAFPRQAERVLREYVAQRPHTALIVRYHPNHAEYFRGAHTGQERVLWSEPSQRHPHRDIHLADAVVFQATTMGLEAAIAGKTVLSLDHSPSHNVFPASQQGVSRGIKSFADLPAALDNALAQPFRSALAQDGANAASQVADVIEAQLARGLQGKMMSGTSSSTPGSTE